MNSFQAGKSAENNANSEGSRARSTTAKQSKAKQSKAKQRTNANRCILTHNTNSSPQNNYIQDLNWR
jgi:hypothetical protein